LSYCNQTMGEANASNFKNHDHCVTGQITLCEQQQASNANMQGLTSYCEQTSAQSCQTWSKGNPSGLDSNCMQQKVTQCLESTCGSFAQDQAPGECINALGPDLVANSGDEVQINGAQYDGQDCQPDPLGLVPENCSNEAKNTAQKDPDPQQTPSGQCTSSNCQNAMNYAHQYCASRSGVDKRSCLENAIQTCGNDSACADSVFSSQGINRQELLATENDLNQIEEDASLVQNLINQCSQGKSEAAKCCGNPNSCYQGGENMNGLLQTVAMMKGATGGSISESCDMMDKLSQAGTLSNSVALGICQNNRNECDSQCKDVQGRLSAQKNQVQGVCANSSLEYIAQGSSRCGSQMSFLDKSLSQASKNIAQCEALSEKQVQLGSQIGALAVASKLSQACASQAESQANDSVSSQEYADVGFGFSGDCSNPSFSNSPACVACRANPSLGQCALLTGLNEEPSVDYASAQDTSSVDLTKNQYKADQVGLSSLNDDVESNDPSMSSTSQASVSSGNSNGGGGRLGSSGGSSMKALGNSKYASSNKGYNTNILRGTKGGGGYRSSSGFRSPASGLGWSIDKWGNTLNSPLKAGGYYSNIVKDALKNNKQGLLEQLMKDFKARDIKDLMAKAKSKDRQDLARPPGTLGHDPLLPDELRNLASSNQGIKKFLNHPLFSVNGFVFNAGHAFSLGLLSTLGLLFFIWKRKKLNKFGAL
ncbi:MAG: hypothetical protein KDD50_03750, partial [Bdellovibrionales bacterium]|nr:hypothetical protein [Bdellovibrionales bacterium]